MRYLFGLSCVLALALMGCSETAGDGGGGGDGGTGGNAGSGGQASATFSYSVITSGSGTGADLLDELRDSALPNLKAGGALVYALWGQSPEPHDDFDAIPADQLALMLSWTSFDPDLLATELGGLAGASQVETSLYRASLRGDEEEVGSGPGFYIHRFNRYHTEDIEEVLSLSERAWVTWEPTFGTEVVGVWRELDERDGLTRLLRVAWYRDLANWVETRDFGRDPESFVLFAQRKGLEVDDDGWSASLLER